jgi:hypothetical protein
VLFLVQIAFFARFPEEKAIANDALFEDVGSSDEKWHDL